MLFRPVKASLELCDDGVHRIMILKNFIFCRKRRSHHVWQQITGTSSKYRGFSYLRTALFLHSDLSQIVVTHHKYQIWFWQNVETPFLLVLWLTDWWNHSGTTGKLNPAESRRIDLQRKVIAPKIIASGWCRRQVERIGFTCWNLIFRDSVPYLLNEIYQ